MGGRLAQSRIPSNKAAEGRRYCESHRSDEETFKATSRCDWLMACPKTIGQRCCHNAVGVFSFLVHLVPTGRHYHSLVAKVLLKSQAQGHMLITIRFRPQL